MMVDILNFLKKIDYDNMKKYIFFKKEKQCILILSLLNIKK
jgi:hypothetical protein